MAEVKEVGGPFFYTPDGENKRYLDMDEGGVLFDVLEAVARAQEGTVMFDLQTVEGGRKHTVRQGIDGTFSYFCGKSWHYLAKFPRDDALPGKTGFLLQTCGGTPSGSREISASAKASPEEGVEDGQAETGPGDDGAEAACGVVAAGVEDGLEVYLGGFSRPYVMMKNGETKHFAELCQSDAIPGDFANFLLKPKGCEKFVRAYHGPVRYVPTIKGQTGYHYHTYFYPTEKPDEGKVCFYIDPEGDGVRYPVHEGQEGIFFYTIPEVGKQYLLQFPRVSDKEGEPTGFILQPGLGSKEQHEVHLGPYFRPYILQKDQSRKYFTELQDSPSGSKEEGRFAGFLLQSNKGAKFVKAYVGPKRVVAARDGVAEKSYHHHVYYYPTTGGKPSATRHLLSLEKKKEIIATQHPAWKCVEGHVYVKHGIEHPVYEADTKDTDHTTASN